MLWNANVVFLCRFHINNFNQPLDHKFTANKVYQDNFGWGVKKSVEKENSEKKGKN